MRSIWAALLGPFIVIVCSYPDSLAFDLSRFDPIGHTLLNPVREAIPKLNIRGFIINSNIGDLRGHSSRAGTSTNLYKHYDLLSAEWLADLKINYRYSDSLKVDSVIDWRYQAAYDWNRWNHWPKQTEREMKYYHRTKDILRELYLTKYWRDWDLVLGKQQMAWENMDFRVNDIINPFMNFDGPQQQPRQYEYRRIPLWMANITYFWSDYYLQFLYIPDYEPDWNPGAGSPWRPLTTEEYRRFREDYKWNLYDNPLRARFPGSRLLKRDIPNAWQEPQIATRFGAFLKWFDLTLLYYYHFDTYPAVLRRGRIAGTESGYFFEPTFTRLHTIGVELDRNFYFWKRAWGLRFASRMDLNKYLLALNEVNLPHEDLYAKAVFNRISLSIESNLEIEHLRDIPILKDIFTGRQGFLLLVIRDQIYRYDDSYSFGFPRLVGGSGSHRADHILTFNLNRSFWFTNDRLSYSNTFYYIPDHGVWRQNFQLIYTLSDHLWLLFHLEWYSGDREVVYGRYKNFMPMGIQIKYSF